ncbi:MAG TPA: CvpA family protein [Bacteroidia bacterium]|nr:CvpA family protein [Bacteroidia bacterium]HNT79051.1 CvpA family protein [Bacteroidia bacterium]
MNILDLILAIPLVIGFIKGMQKGILYEVAMIIGVVLGIYFGFKFTDWVSALISSISDNKKVLAFISFLLVLVIIITIMVLLAKLFESALKAMTLNWTNKLAGGLFGLIKFGIVLSIFLWMLKTVEPYWNFINQSTKEESVLYDKILKIASMIKPAITDVQNEFNEKVGEVSP